MKRFFATLMMVAILVTEAFAGGGELKNLELFKSGTNCDGQIWNPIWINNLGYDIYVRQMELAGWFNAGQVADFEMRPFRYSTAIILLDKHIQGESFTWAGMDHYKDTGGWRLLTKVFSPDWIRINQGDGFILELWCQQYQPPGQVWSYGYTMVILYLDANPEQTVGISPKR